MKSRHNQSFDETLIDLDFDKEAIELYRESATHFVKFVSGREGVPKVVEFTALEIKFMYGCDVEWNGEAPADAAPAALPVPAAPGEENASPSTGDSAPSTGDEQAPLAQGNKSPSAADVLTPPAAPPRAAASNAAISDGAAPQDIPKTRTGGDWIIPFQYIDPESIMDTD